ncbi:hypothetical protein BS329_35270 [Amycolatopsis coloradensis]|uniref:Carrier domain-containing protein n=1 Tax=Amycolatopsis coloradensis TaxID=76021 RepID=A0A1R0KH49_9PSEU|nr:non-ribosomal peptide synthetase [Amycolatopsis coloradensis]OLZ45013.1 hypothetical protein BS329_35270 [Amycolatopsis coloradensis]
MNPIADAYPLTPTQEGMLFHSRTSEGLYVELVTFRVGEDLDLGAFEAAWAGAVARHAVLRTGFAWERLSSPHQVVLHEATLPIEHADLTGASEAGREAELAELVADLRGRPFDLKKPPLMRLLVVRVPGEHVIVWCYHHLLIDGWSSALLLGEIARAMAGDQPTGPVPSFRDHVAWLRGRDPERARAFWCEYLAGAEPTQLGFAGTKPGATASGRYRDVALHVAEDRVRRLRETATARRTTLGCLVDAAWGVTLARFSGRDDVVFGVTTAGRPHEVPGATAMVGMFITTVPLRLSLGGDDWLTEFSAGRLRVLDHQHTPLPDVRRWTGLPSLFDTVVVFENYPDDAVGGLRVRDMRYETRTNYPLTLVVRAGAALRVLAVVDDTLFAVGEAEAMLAFFDVVLDRLVSGAADIVAPPARERFLLLRGHNETTDPGTVRTLTPALTARHLTTRPGHPAVECGETVLTYRQLDERVRELAGVLVAAGVSENDRVGLCLARSADLVAALLAVHRVGAAFVPIDPGHPVARIASVLADAEPVVVLTDEESAPRLPRGTRQVRTTDDAIPFPGQSTVDAGGLAYLMYTSGSTGTPKGVAISHGALANLVWTLAAHPGLTPDDRLLALTTLTFDTSLAELLVPLAVGATVLVGTGVLGLDGRELDRYAAERRVTAFQATPSRYRVLLGSGWRGVGRPKLWSCGEAFPPDLAAPLAERGESVWNLYGPTETTVYSSVERIHADTTRVTVGLPVANTALHVLDRRGEPVPAGVVGELHIAGLGVADGYWRRPELTAERFVTDPFGIAAGGRMYRTGDLARPLADGRVEVLGRIDRQLKLHGHRIEPAEIEKVLLAHPAVRDAAVTVRDDRLVGYVVADGADTDELRAHLLAFVPSYMVPDTIVALPELPLSSAGKTDIRALPDPAPSVPPAPDELDGLEAVVAKLFRDVLGVTRIGRADDFFALGGDSLRAMRLIARVQAEFDVDFDVELLLDHPDVEGVARLVADRTENP